MQWTKQHQNDFAIRGHQELFEEMKKALQHFDNTQYHFGNLKNGLMYSGIAYVGLFGTAAIPAFAEGASIIGAVMRRDIGALAELTKIGFSNTKQIFSRINVNARLSLLIASADGGAYALGTAATRIAINESLKQGLLVSVRQTLRESLIRQGVKQQLINKILMGLPK